MTTRKATRTLGDGTPRVLTRVLHLPLCLEAFPLVTLLRIPTSSSSLRRSDGRLTGGVRTNNCTESRHPGLPRRRREIRLRGQQSRWVFRKPPSKARTASSGSRSGISGKRSSRFWLCKKMSSGSLGDDMRGHRTRDTKGRAPRNTQALAE